MTQVRVQNIDSQCESCGYPFDIGDKAYDMTDDYGPLACSKKCADWLIDDELRKNRDSVSGTG